MPEIYRHMMGAPSLRLDRCAVCGAPYPLEQHHVVWRSWGELYEDGEKVEKPTITLCGFGNNLPWCHGLVHHRMLHFDYREGEWKWLRTKKPTKYQDALEMDGWKSVVADAGKHTR